MNLVIDAQLPPALGRWIAAQGHQATHVFDVALQAAADGTGFTFECRRLSSALREFLKAAHCEVSIVQEERKRRVLFEPTRSILDKRNKAVEWQRPIHEADGAFCSRLQTQPLFGSLSRRSG